MFYDRFAKTKLLIYHFTILSFIYIRLLHIGPEVY